MKKGFVLLIALFIFTSCSSLTKQQRMERDMFDPKQTRKEKKMEKKVTGKTYKYNKPRRR